MEITKIKIDEETYTGSGSDWLKCPICSRGIPGWAVRIHLESGKRLKCTICGARITIINGDAIVKEIK